MAEKLVPYTKKYFNNRLKQLENERADFVPMWKDVKRFISPFAGRFYDKQKNKRSKWNNIVNNTATISSRICASGLMSGFTSDATLWFKMSSDSLKTEDKETIDPDKDREFREYLTETTDSMFLQMSKTNMYTVLQGFYRELADVGIAAFAIVEDVDDVFRLIPFTVGEYYVDQGDNLRVDTFGREFEMTVGNLVKRFGYDNVSKKVQGLYNGGQLSEQKVDVVHFIERNSKREFGKLDNQNMPYIGVYYEKGNGLSDTDGQYLEVKGYNEFPVICVRWDAYGGTTYATDSPGIMALGDVKQLQHQERRKGQNIDKLSDPPLQAPSSLETNKISGLPGRVSFYDANLGGDGIRPLYQVNPQIQELRVDINEVQTRIERAYFVDLFLLLAQDTKGEKTATEVTLKNNEKLLQLGPVVHRIKYEMLDPMVNRIYRIMKRAGRLPKPPEGYENKDISVEYQSPLIEAQKAAEVNKTERFLGFIGQLVGIDPTQTVARKIDWGAAVDETARDTGVNPRLIIPEDRVNAEKDQANQEQQLAQGAELVKTASESGKNIAQAQSEGSGLGESLLPPIG